MNHKPRPASGKSRLRIDYMPGPAALQALRAAEELHPQCNAQALIDRLIITGLSALVHGRWEPPRLTGRSREAWRLPEELHRLVPGANG